MRALDRGEDFIVTRNGRAVDLVIAAVALANGLPLFTRNTADFEHLTVDLEVRSV